MTDTNDLVQWLREQIATDRAHAEKDQWCAEQATPGWVARYGQHLEASWLVEPELPGHQIAQFTGPNHQANLMLAARFKPSTVAARARDTLAQCDAHEAILDLHGIVHRDIGWLEWDESEHAEMSAELPVCGLCVPRHSSFTRREDVPEGPCRTVRLLALAYQHRPGYRERWRT